MRVLAVIVCLALVAPANPGTITGAGPGWVDLRTDLERQVSLEVEAARRIVQAEEYYRRGGILLRESRRSEALDQFRHAESIVLDAGEDAYMTSSLRSYLHELRSRIAGLTAPADLPRPDVEQSHSAETLVDRATLGWLASAVRRPIPEEAVLRSIFRSERVPEELIYVGLVESGYRSDAVSSAGAAGPWQFIDETGRRYGLTRGKGKDDRRDLLKSTRAAAHYLRDLYGLLGDWTLALAGYNAGEYRVLRAMHQVDAKDFWSVRSLLPKETAEYVSRVLAAISMAKKAGILPDEAALGSVAPPGLGNSLSPLFPGFAVAHPGLLSPAPLGRKARACSVRWSLGGGRGGCVMDGPGAIEESRGMSRYAVVE